MVARTRLVEMHREAVQRIPKLLSPVVAEQEFENESRTT